MDDYISRADAIEAVRGLSVLVDDEDFPYFEGALKALRADWNKAMESAQELLSALPSAEAEPIVIRAKTFMRKEDFDKWAEDIKRQNKSIVCIPCDAEVVSADAVHGWITDRNPTEDGEYMVTIADEYDDGFVCTLRYGEPLMPICKVNGKCWYDTDDDFGDCPYYDIVAWQPLPTPYKGGDDE